MRTTRTRLTALASISLVLAAGLSACGSDDESTPAADNAVSSVPKATFVDQGNQLCVANEEAIASVFKQMSQPPSQAQLTDAFNNLVTQSYKFEGDLLAVGAPKGQEKAFVDQILAMHHVVNTVETQGQEAFFATEDNPFKAVTDTLVNDFGLTSCQTEE